VVVFLFTHPLVALFSRSAAFGSAKFTGLNHVRTGGIATRNVGEPELATAGVGAAGSSAGGVTLSKGEGRRTGEPGRTATAMGAEARQPAASARATNSRPAAPSRAAKPTAGRPAAGATAAERAAARRGLQRDGDDQSGRNDS
jgi:preprotein translocase subunit SecD